MEVRSRVDSRWNAVLVVALVLFMLTAWMVVTDQSGAASSPLPPPVESSDLVSGSMLFQIGSAGTIFAKYDGFDGESKDANHPMWIDVLSMDWAVERDRVDKKAGPVIDDLVLTYDYDKSTPKLVEKLLNGEVIPKLEIEFTATYGGVRTTYLRYELTNVIVTSYVINQIGGGGAPTVAVGNTFEKIEVTYTEYDDTGSSKGNVEYEWSVGKG